MKIDKLSKEDKLFVKNNLDRLNRNMNTYFLNIYEFNLLSNLLNRNYKVFNENIEKKVIYINKLEISLLKITPKTKRKLEHKDYMGAIYNLGIKEEKIGDIICADEGYLYIFKDMVNYVINNLTMVGNIPVTVEEIDIDTQLNKSFLLTNIHVSSLRNDIILAHLFNISRKETLNKIMTGDLFINSININKGVKEVKIDDIITLKKCGKFKVLSYKVSKKNKYIVEIMLYN